MTKRRMIAIALTILSFAPPRPATAITPAGEGIIGAVLSIAGISMMVYGFKQVDISAPNLDLSSWGYTTDAAITWWADADGTVRNTGNVALTNVRIYVTYYDAGGNALSDYYGYGNWTYAGSGAIATGGSANWSHLMSTGYSYPQTGRIRAEYEYVKIYESRSAAVGWLGLAATGVGAYLIFDALYTSSRLKAALNSHGYEMALMSDLPNRYGGLKITRTL